MCIKAILYGRAVLSVFLVAAILVVPTGCRKSGGDSIFAGTIFRFSGYAQLQPLRAFINTGEILDAKVLAGLAIADSIWISDAAIHRGPPAFDSVYFATSDSGFIWGHSESFSFHLRRSGNDLTFTAVSAFAQDLDTTFVTAVDTSDVLYPYLLADRKYDSGPFYLYQWTYQAFATQTSANQLSLPGMIRDILTPVVGYGSGIFNNKYNPHFDHRLLSPGDTLIFRECAMLMEKE